MNNSGSVVESASYDSFGNPTGNLATRYQFTGREKDDVTGLYYYRARFYDAKLGRFISEDPIGFAGGDVNLYGYTFNNPLNHRDPSGKIVPALVVGAVVVGGLILTSPEYVNAPGPGDPVYRPQNPVIANALIGTAGALGLNYFGGKVFGAFCQNSGGAIVNEGAEAVVKGAFNSVDDLPPVKNGFERVFRGSGHPDIPQVSPSMRGVPPNKVPSGADDFLSPAEAKLHSGAGHPNGVSVSTQPGLAEGYKNGGGVIAYDIPSSVFNKLPTGDPLLGEKVFKYSIPEIYKVGVIK